MGNRLYSLVMFLIVSVLGGVLVAGLAVPLTGIAAETGRLLASTANSLPQELETPAQAQRSNAYLSDGSLLASFYDENRTYVTLDNIAQIMRQAQVDIEDTRFYEHGAVDLIGSLRALVRTSSGETQGASTLTQQYVKLVLIQKAQEAGDKAAEQAVQDRSMAEKIKEIRYAVALEQKLTKDQILERYMNIAYYGDGAYGVEAAARHYFGVSAKDLSLAQAAMLAGLVQNPANADPVHHPVVATARRNDVINRMAELGHITPEQQAAAKAEPFDASKVQASAKGCTSSRYPFICQYLEKTLTKMPSLGASAQDRKNVLYRGGLTIQTSIDPRIQDIGESSIAQVFAPNDPVISLSISMQPGTGLIWSMAQSRPKMGTNADAGETFYNYAVTHDMGGAEGYQGGSTFKAFTIAAALKKGYPFDRTYDAQAHVDFTGQYFTSCEGKFRQNGTFKVDNASKANGVMDMLTAAKYSVNTYMVYLEQSVGLCEVTDMAQTLGLKLSMGGDLKALYSDKPSFTLGTAEIAPLSLVEAYATFGARGVHCDPILITAMTNRDGQPIDPPSANCKQVIDENVADRVNVVLQGPYTSGGTAESARPPAGVAIAGKTGTEDGTVAIWCMGYNPDVAATGMISIDKSPQYADYWAGTYNGLAGKRMPASGTYLSGSSGSEAGRLILKPTLLAALEGKPNTQFVDPGKTTTAQTVPVPKCNSIAACQQALADAEFGAVIKQIPNDADPGTFLGLSPRGTAPQYSTIYILVSAGPDGAGAPTPPGG